ncbi:V-type ATP synthase subunit I [Aliagarivorans marinus]|uniref:V-type ATP synthase subunit I n=1 Tax=Aliagarivorans marinus TaxID=561965 RepID=UPI00041DCAEB|nr:hypothetical protein [Aliagarivorans marinus]
MSIRSLKRLTLGGSTRQQRELLSALQGLGCTHLIPLSEDNAQANRALAMQQPNDASEALAWLGRAERRRRPVTDKDLVDVDELIEQVLQNKRAIRAEADRRDHLKQHLAALKPWGEFTLPPLETTNNRRFWFYVVPLKDLDAVHQSELPCQEIHRDQKRAWIVVVSKEEPAEDAMPVERSRIGRHTMSQIEQMIEICEQHLEDLRAEREAFTRWIYPLSQSLAARHDTASLLMASSGVRDENEFFLMQGWVPADQEEALVELSEQHAAAILLEDPTADDQPPTLLENDDQTGGGAEAMSFFQTPNYRAWDPGKLVFFSFSLFFAMIMSDAMYSALFGGIIWMYRKRLRSSEKGVRLMNLGMFMSLLGIVWGVMVGSYFGVSPSSGPLAWLAFLDLNNYPAMMKISVFIGVAHLMAANLMTAYINRPNLKALAPVGWAALMFGGMMLWFGADGPLPSWLGTGLGSIAMLGGAGLVCVFSSDRKVDSPKTAALRALDGAKAIYNITGAFGDVLSYMRLFALGLSGASLAMTFNSLAAQVVDSSPVSGVLFGGLILLLGHLLNFALCIMSGVVHGMRLNVIEFVNWGLSDEGYPFNAFRKKED